MFPDGVRAVNVGLDMFAQPLAANGASVTRLDWRPPAEGDRDVGLLLARLEDDPDDPIGRRIAAANATAVDRLLAAQPMLVDVQPARAALGLEGRHILHAGPPIAWQRMCGPVEGAIIGAILFEGWATSPEQATALVESGGVDLSPCHDHGAVGPMAGVISPSMPVVVVENVASGMRAHATLNEGLGRVLRFGAYDTSVLDRLHWFVDVLGPALSNALQSGGPLDLRSLTGQALQMGDEGHNRNIAATSLFTRTIAPALVRTADATTAAAVFDFLRGNDHFFLNLSMAACKSAMDSAHGIEASTVVTAMARNGVDFGIRLSGAGDAWFTTPVGVPDGLYFPGYGPDDANPDLGDSAITETFGIGGFAMAAAPAIVRFVGGSPADALEFTRLMGRITLARNPSYALATPRVRWDPDRNRCPPGRRLRDRAGHQHGNRPPPGGRRPDRCGDRARAVGLLLERDRRAWRFPRGGRAQARWRHDRSNVEPSSRSAEMRSSSTASVARSTSNTRTLGRRPATSPRWSRQVGAWSSRTATARRSASSSCAPRLVPDDAPVPRLNLEMSVADSQGGIGHILGQALLNELAARGLPDRVACVLSHVVVDPDDPAFGRPTKPIGPFYSKEESDQKAERNGWTMIEDSGRGYRRVVASPEPLRIVEGEPIRALVDAGYVVIAVGGGGVAVVETAPGQYRGVEAVIDKDRASALLASSLDIPLLVSVDRR